MPLRLETLRQLNQGFLKKTQTRWSGHIVPIVDKSTLQQLFYGEFGEEKYYLCNLKSRYKNSIRITIKTFGMNPKEILLIDRAGGRK